MKTTVCAFVGAEEGSVGDEVVTPREKASGAFPMPEQYHTSEKLSNSVTLLDLGLIVCGKLDHGARPVSLVSVYSSQTLTFTNC